MTCRRPSLNKAAFALIVAGLLCGTAGAFAQDSMPQLSTASHWVIGPISEGNADASGRKFCSLKASFSNGINFVLARDTAGGQSLALEYPSKAFAAGATLPVILAAGGGQVQVNALAATNRVLLVETPVGGDIERAIGQSNVFSVRVAQYYQAFGVGGIVAAQQQLALCVDTLGKDGVFEPVKVSAETDSKNFQTNTALTIIDRKTISDVTPEEARKFKPAIAAREAMLADEILRLRDENAKLMRENQRLSGELIALEQRAGGGVAKAAALPQITRSSKSIAMPDSQSLSDAVATYLATEAVRCTGDFANKTGKAGATRLDAEIACLDTPAGSASDYAAAIAFTRGKGILSVEMFQGPAGLIEQALEARAEFRAKQKP